MNHSIELTFRNDKIQGLSPERVSAAVDALLSSDDSDTLFSPIHACVLESASRNQIAVSSVELGEGHCFIELEMPGTSKDSAQMKLFIADVMEGSSGKFVEISFTGEEQEERGDPSQLPLHVLHKSKGIANYGPGEMEVFRRYCAEVVGELMPEAQVSVDEIRPHVLTIACKDNPCALWCQRFFQNRLGHLPVEVDVQIVGTDFEYARIDPLDALTWVVKEHSPVQCLRKGSYVVRQDSVPAHLAEQLSRSCLEIFGELISIARRPLDPASKDLISNYSTWAGYVLSPVTDSFGILRQNIENASPFQNHKGADSFHSVATMWDLPMKSSDIPSIAVDQKGSIGDVAFGIQHHTTSGRYTVRAWVLNTARLCSVGGPADLDLSRFGGSLYEANLPLYPGKFGGRYIAISTKYRRPLLEFTMELDKDFNLTDINLREVQGMIDFQLTPGQFRNHRDLYVQNQYEHSMIVADGLGLKALRRGRIHISAAALYSENDRMVEELHLLLYEAAGRWMSRYPDIAVPYRVSRDPFNSSQFLQSISGILGNRSSNPHELREDLAAYLYDGTPDQQRRVLEILRVTGEYSTDVNKSHATLAVDHYLRVGAGARIDLNRISQHQVSASLGGLPILSRSFVESRIATARNFEREKDLRLSESTQLNMIQWVSRFIGKTVTAVVDSVQDKGYLAHAGGVSKPIAILLGETIKRPIEQGDVVSLKIVGYALKLDKYIGEILPS